MITQRREILSVVIGLLIGVITAVNYMYSIMLLLVSILAFVSFLIISGKLNLFHYVMVYIPSVVLSPIISLGVGPAIRLDDLWLLMGLIISVIKLPQRKIKIKILPNKSSYIFLFFICWVVISILISSFREPYFYSNNDWFDVLKNLKFLVLYVIALNLELDKSRFIKLTNVVVLSLCLSAFFGIMQYINFANVNTWLTKYFIYETQLHNLNANQRVIGTLGNSNVLAGALLLGVSISLSRYLNEFKLRHLIPLSIFSISFFMTQSRTVLICMIFLAVSIFVLSFIKNEKKFKVLLFSSLFSVVPFIGLSFAPEKFFYRMSFLNDVSTDNSLQARISLWKSVYVERTSGNLLTGTGPLGKLHYYYDNEWLMILTTYGIIGLSLFLILFFLIYINLGKIRKVFGNQSLSLSIALQCLILSYGIYMMTLAVFQQLQMMPIIILTLGILLSLRMRQPRIR